METYILRIYRRPAGQAERIVGMSENVETGETKRFHDFGQLRAILLHAQSEPEAHEEPKRNENEF